ncbi:hypothetical protein DNTS_014730 [Danionella cerebrum]|uniref:Ig-like domain-containing protein n=1 Tax=Danionella cerebrum TaxID=2873325 RepID=A0A553PMQ9_9TELE|nr:hypothetical protein DNTS_014730 [Danionella translucida]
MEPRVERFLRMILLLKFCCLWSVQGLSVVFSNPEPVFVVRGQTLILQAQIELLHTERLSKVTWERETKDSGKSSVLAEFPLRATEGRVKLENQGATLRMVDFQSEDEGVYAVTVIEANGKRRALHTSVQEYDDPARVESRDAGGALLLPDNNKVEESTEFHGRVCVVVSVGHVSVLVNVSHHVLHCLESWGTEPSFSWLHEKVPVEEHEGRSSPDRSTLHVSGRFCGSFTCVVSNRLGHSSATYSAAGNAVEPEAVRRFKPRHHDDCRSSDDPPDPRCIPGLHTVEEGEAWSACTAEAERAVRRALVRSTLRIYNSNVEQIRFLLKD